MSIVRPRKLGRAPEPGTERAPRGVAEAAAWLRQARVLPCTPDPVPRIGAEYELLALEPGTRRPAQWRNGRGELARWLQAHAREHRWLEDASAKGAPRWRLPNQGGFTFEPGGQVEYASPPFASVESLVADLDATIGALHDTACAFGIELLACGIDPLTPLADAPMQFHTPRYERMAQYFDGLGDAGARMMRQTASLQVNIGSRTDPDASWRVAGALAPYLTALFANSARYEGRDTGSASFRARTWRQLDPARTGLPQGGADVAAGYARFALAAPAMLDDGRPFDARERTLDEWREHLTTLFPEVRPRGYLEIRSIDSVELADAARALRMITGLLWHPEAFGCVREVIGDPDPALLERAGELGMGDAALRLRAKRLLDLGESAAAELSGGRSAAPAPPRP